MQLFIFFLIGMIYRPWITLSGSLSSGDWPYLYTYYIKQFSWVPEQRFLWLAPYYQILTKIIINFGLSWHLVERLLWFVPWVGICIYSSWKLTRSWLGVLIYTTNTYALMLVGGGQMGVAMAYAMAPAVLVNRWLLPVQVMFDPRIALLTLIIALRKNSKQFVFPVLITVVLHSYWWIPLLKNPSILSTQFHEATADAVKYLSFASFSNSLSLLHPNWPENIFGKVYFQRPEFLIIPIIAFATLRLNKYFALLVLIGAFLAKGTNEPFGGIYLWLFNNIPGFSLFRDPTKFYLFLALGYSVLISGIKKPIFAFLFVLFWIFTIRESITGSLTGTFKPVEISSEYQQLKNPDVAWYPKKSRFSFSGYDYDANKKFQYIVVPDDIRGEIFVTDRMYDKEKRQDAILFIATMSGLRRLEEYKELAVFEVL